MIILLPRSYRFTFEARLSLFQQVATMYKENHSTQGQLRETVVGTGYCYKGSSSNISEMFA